MKKIKLFLFYFFLINISIKVFGQVSPWYITRGISGQVDEAWGVDVDSSGNIYWAVEEKDQWPFWYFNIVLFKIDANAQPIWQSTSWGSGTGFNDKAFVTKVNGAVVYLGGRTDSTANNTSGDALVMSYNTINGNLNWAKNISPNPDFGYQEIDGLMIQPDGIYVSGWTQGQTTSMDFLVQKIDLSGNPLWINSWDYNSFGKFDGGNGHMAMDNNFLYVAGHVNRANIASFDGQMDLACFNRSNGTYQWNVTWGGSSYDDGLGLTMSSDSMLYVVGYTGSFGNGSQTYFNKFSRTGQLKWSRLWGGSGTEDCRALVSDGDSIIYVVGTTSSYGNGAKDIFVLKYDSAGTLKNSLYWGGAYNEVASDVAIHEGYLYITGTTESFGNGSTDGHKTDALLLKINGRTMQAPDSITTFSNEIDEKNQEISVFPNPCNSLFVLQSKHRNELQIKKTEFKVYDIVGQEIFKSEIQDEKAEIHFDLPDGIYFLKLETNKSVQTKKIVVQK